MILLLLHDIMENRSRQLFITITKMELALLLIWRLLYSTVNRYARWLYQEQQKGGYSLLYRDRGRGGASA